jgi:hypothetical protein
MDAGRGLGRSATVAMPHGLCSATPPTAAIGWGSQRSGHGAAGGSTPVRRHMRARGLHQSLSARAIPIEEDSRKDVKIC